MTDEKHYAPAVCGVRNAHILVFIKAAIPYSKVAVTLTVSPPKIVQRTDALQALKASHRSLSCGAGV